MKKIITITSICVLCLKGMLYAQNPDADKYWIYEDFATIWEENGSVIQEKNVSIAFSGNVVQIVNPFENNGISIVSNGQNVIINSTLPDTEVRYILSGNTTNGSVKIYSNYKFELLLNGVSIQNPAGAAINIQSGKKATVILQENTINSLSDGSAYITVENEDMKGAFFSEGKLIFEGKGSLSLSGNYKHAICSDDYIQIDDGSIVINQAVSDGIHVNDYFRMNGGNLKITSLKDGIDCETDSLIITGGNIQITTNGQGGKGLKSMGNMTVSGGTINLKTTGNAYYDTSDLDISSPSGIKCGANFTISGDCSLTINSTGSAGKGISVDSALVFNGGNIFVTTSGGIYKYNSKLDSSAKGIKSQGNLTVNSGTIIIKTTGSGSEGMESKKNLTINGGKIEIEANDDGINAATNITINGGEIYVYSSTNDGIDSNGTMTITGGLIVSSGNTAPEEGFDCDQHTFKITGGTLVGTGGATSNPTASVSTQRSLVYNTSGSVNAGQLIRIESSTGEVLTYKLPRSYSKMTLLFSSPQFTANTNYTIYSGGNVSGGTNFHGVYEGADYTKGTQAATFTTTSMLTTVGTSPGPGPR